MIEHRGTHVNTRFYCTHTHTHTQRVLEAYSNLKSGLALTSVALTRAGRGRQYLRVRHGIFSEET